MPKGIRHKMTIAHSLRKRTAKAVKTFLAKTTLCCNANFIVVFLRRTDKPGDIILVGLVAL